MDWYLLCVEIPRDKSCDKSWEVTTHILLLKYNILHNQTLHKQMHKNHININQGANLIEWGYPQMLYECPVKI